MATVTPLPLRKAVSGRPSASQAVDWRDDAMALLAERTNDARRMAKVVPLIRFVRASAEDVNAERAAGIVQLEVERIARRGGDVA